MSDGYTSTLLGGRTRSLNRYFADWVSKRFDMPVETRELIARLAEASSLALQLKHSCLDRSIPLALPWSIWCTICRRLEPPPAQAGPQN